MNDSTPPTKPELPTSVEDEEVTPVVREAVYPPADETSATLIPCPRCEACVCCSGAGVVSAGVAALWAMSKPRGVR